MIQFLAGQEAIIVGNADLLGDMASSQRVVTGDHHRTNAGRAAICHCVCHLRPRRIDHAEQPDQSQLALQRRIGCLHRLAIPATHADTQNTHPLGGHLVVSSQQARPPSVVEGL